MPDSGPHAQAASDQGMLRGRHYTDYLDEVKTLRREGMDSAAATLLAKLVTAAESEAQARGWDVAPWYYEQLAIIFRKRNDLDAEIAILERYAAQPRSSAQTGAALRQRLQKAGHCVNGGDSLIRSNDHHPGPCMARASLMAAADSLPSTLCLPGFAGSTFAASMHPLSVESLGLAP